MNLINREEDKMRLLLENGIMINHNRTMTCDIAIKDSIIEKITIDNLFLTEKFDKVIDCSGKYILPGVIDPHVHLRDMKQRNKETIRSGTNAAIHNGVTTLFAMPNTIPKISNINVLKKYQSLVKNTARCNVGIYGGIGPGFDMLELAAMKDQGIFGLKIYPGDTSEKFELDWSEHENLNQMINDTIQHGIDSDMTFFEYFDYYYENQLNSNNEFESKVENWWILFKECQKLNLPIIFHLDTPKSKSFIKSVKDGYKTNNRLKVHNNIYSKFNEITALSFIYYILKIYKYIDLLSVVYPRICFAHVSTAQIANLINMFSDVYKGIETFVEISPHHLFLDYSIGEDLEIQSFGKVLAPLRAKGEREYLLKFVNNDGISFFGTDHAPHSELDKNKAFIHAPSGIASLDYYVQYMLTKAFEGSFSLETFVKFSSYNPASYLGLNRKGQIAEGFDADVFIVSQVEKYDLDPSIFLSNAKFSPFDLSGLKVRVDEVILAGFPTINKIDTVINDKELLLRND